MTSFGLRHGPPEVIAALARGALVDPSTYYFRTTPRFETGRPKYAFLNRLLAVASGRSAPRGSDLHDRRDPLRPPWTATEETFSSLPRSRRSLDAHPCPSRLSLHDPPTGRLPCAHAP
jgi:hypothetical protein